MAVIMSRRYRRHRYHRNLRKISKIDKALDKEIIRFFGNIGNFRNDTRRQGTSNLKEVERALGWISEKTDCIMCGSFLVEMSKDACCQSCLEMWVFLDDGRKCPFCDQLLKDVLNRRQVDKLCGLVGLKTKNLTKSGHFTQALVEYRTQKLNMKIPN
uniref:Uncharacterized protein n=1 Tax=Schizaphis graminum TaxID=13262 RepID=A0A2S2NXG5_SCHGA